MFTSRAVPLPAENVDTDQIVPARYLKVTDKDGLAEALFRDWRFEEDGSLKEPRFVLDRPEMAGRRILLVGDNFGAGSSREHAPWALTAWGIRGDPLDVVRRHLPQQQPQERRPADRRGRRRPTRACSSCWPSDPDAEFTVDLAEQGVLLPDGRTLDFDIDPFAKQMILAGTDELGYLLAKEPDIDAWEGLHPARIDSRVGAA